MGRRTVTAGVFPDQAGPAGPGGVHLPARPSDGKDGEPPEHGNRNRSTGRGTAGPSAA